MSNQVKKPTYDTKLALAVANKIYSKHGYTKTDEAQYGERQSNKQRLVEALSVDNPKYSKKDMTSAEEQIEHYQGLLLFKLGDNQSSYEEQVLSSVASEKIQYKMLGILASLPHVYKVTLDREKRQEHEKKMASKSNFIGDVKKRNIFDIVVEMVKPLPHKGLYIVSFMQGDNILKYFTPNDPAEDEIVVGKKLQISAYVKDHQINKYNGGKETIVNRIKVLRKGDK